MRRFSELDGSRPHLHRHGRVRRRGGRAPRPVDHGRRHPANPMRASRAILTAIAAKFEGEPCCGLARHRRRRPFRQDHPQRHRICRHADDRRDLRHPARRARHGAQGRSATVFERMEQGPAQLLSDRDHRHGARRRRSEDRQAGRRHDPRPRRPEGHRQMVGDRGADARRAGDRDRGGGRGARRCRR